MGWTPKKAVLQQTISAITAASWEAINQTVVRSARQTKLEPAAMVRIDSTVVKALMHEPRLPFHARCARNLGQSRQATAHCYGMRCG
jgi:IS5 family transposase